MRRRVGVQKAAAADAGVEPETHRLTDIEVKEVSVVDRPANRRKFLVVKREQPAKDAEPMKISPEAKTELENKIKGIVEAAGAVSKSLETAEATAGAPTPAELLAALETMGKLLSVGATAQETEKSTLPPFLKKKKKAGEEEDSSDDEEEDDEDSEDEDSEDEDDEEEKKKKAAKKAGAPVTKAGKKMSRGRKDRLASAVTALRELLSEVDDAPVAKEPATKAAASADSAVTDALRELAAHVAIISKAVSKQKERLDQVAKSTSGSKQVSTEKADTDEDDAATSNVSWPLDMNNKKTRANTPVEKSFF